MDRWEHPDQLIVDCSVAVRWAFRDEEYAAEALEILRDEAAGAVSLSAPNVLPTEIGSAALRALKRGRQSRDAALVTIRTLLDAPITLVRCDDVDLVVRALDIALQWNQRIYDCFYVALAEAMGAEL